jgi:hypothetical protein
MDTKGEKIITPEDRLRFAHSWAANAGLAKPHMCPASLLTNLTPEYL